ncbi:MAG: carboxylating nicotinate-nucleotide diphosphorylase [Desulfonatronovibrio sp.]
MNDFSIFTSFFRGQALDLAHKIIDLALEEDGEDLTSNAVFSFDSKAKAIIRVKQECVICGLPFIDLILARIAGKASAQAICAEGALIDPGRTIAEIHGSTPKILKAERVILNMLSRLSGIATLTREFCARLKGSGVTLLDTRKTSPGMRYPEKYAVLVGGAGNHRLNLESMLMLKDNHIDQCGSITRAVDALRFAYSPCPPIEVECRSIADVEEAVSARADRIMLDNMDMGEMQKALKIIPARIESEISGRVNLENITQLASLRPDYISSGALTHSARSIDISMKIEV